MEGLTAKVFRTFNASNTLQKQLEQAVQFYKNKSSVSIIKLFLIKEIVKKI